MRKDIPESSHRFSINIDIEETVEEMSVFLRLIGCYEAKMYHPFAIPMLVEIDIPCITDEKDVPYIRTFLRKLREVQSRYFVRFVTSLLWAAESDNHDIFYTKTDRVRHRDAILTLNYVGHNEIEVTSQSFLNHQYLMAREICHLINRPVDSADDINDDRSVHGRLIEFHQDLSLTFANKELNNDLHVVFISSDDRDYYLPIPLYGLTKEDAKRKFLSLSRQYDFLNKRHFDYLRESPSHNEIVMELIISIRDYESVHNHERSIAITYGLAELLFGYYVIYREKTGITVSTNELVLFDPVEKDDDVLLGIYSMREAKNAMPNKQG